LRTYTWDEYYEKFYDWAESTQVRNLSALTSLGSADEVGEIIIELQVNVPAANRLLRKAVEEKLAFSGSDLVEFAYINDKEPVTAAIFAGASAGVSLAQGRRHNGRCNGDCANCPPHYGYRYGRWYYGHDHVHGCEFGGNKGSGSMD
jgi:hypothetical protein